MSVPCLRFLGRLRPAGADLVDLAVLEKIGEAFSFLRPYGPLYFSMRWRLPRHAFFVASATLVVLRVTRGGSPRVNLAVLKDRLEGSDCVCDSAWID
ncbi:hypothetical protein N7526_001773 [Penicillium atrosanguineum]|nr:hypothetical protein N7526_001773 [Penicillium atrosanguineum]